MVPSKEVPDTGTFSAMMNCQDKLNMAVPDTHSGFPFCWFQSGEKVQQCDPLPCPATFQPHRYPHTTFPEAIKQLAEHSLVRVPIGVSHQHVHIPTGGLFPPERATHDTHQPRIDQQGCFSDLQWKTGRGVVVDFKYLSIPIHCGDSITPSSVGKTKQNKTYTIIQILLSRQLNSFACMNHWIIKFILLLLGMREGKKSSPFATENCTEPDWGLGVYCKFIYMLANLTSNSHSGDNEC